MPMSTNSLILEGSEPCTPVFVCVCGNHTEHIIVTATF